MPRKISRDNSNATSFNETHSECYECEVFKLPIKNLNDNKEELYRRRDKCANCRRNVIDGEYKYDCIKKLEHSIKRPRWTKGKSVSIDGRTFLQIRELKKEGMKQIEIARLLGLSKSTVSKFLTGGYSPRTTKEIEDAIAEREKALNRK